MESQQAVEAVAGQGLAGDRYFGAASRDRSKEVTLIEIEALEALGRDYDIAVGPGENRRNIVTRGVSLNHLVGREFRVGEVVLRGVRLCEPCSHLESMTVKGALRGLVHRGGLRAAIVAGGVVRVGDDISEAGPNAQPATRNALERAWTRLSFRRAPRGA